jgi:hypothetical protein
MDFVPNAGVEGTRGRAAYTSSSAGGTRRGADRRGVRPHRHRAARNAAARRQRGQGTSGTVVVVVAGWRTGGQVQGAQSQLIGPLDRTAGALRTAGLVAAPAAAGDSGI